MVLLIYEERRIHLEGPERWISVQNKAVEPYDFDAALYNDTFPWEGSRGGWWNTNVAQTWCRCRALIFDFLAEFLPIINRSSADQFLPI